MSTPKDFQVIAITRPDFYPEEIGRICEIMLNGNVNWLHIRKPEASAKEIAGLIEKLPENLYPKLKLHDHFELLQCYNLGGAHLNSRNPIHPAAVKSVSRSLHSLDQLKTAEEYDYVTLSPVFDSISKPGYGSAFSYADLKMVLKDRHNVIALGGVTPEKFPLLKELGFAGAALLGYFFNE